MDESCSHCGGITVAVQRTRLRFLQGGGVPVPLPRSRVPPGGRQGSATSGSSRAGLTVRNSKKNRGLFLPPALRYLWSCRGNRPAPLGGVPLVSFGAPPDNRMSIAASDHSGNDDSVPLPPSRRSTVQDSDPEMVAMLTRAAESFGLEWRPPPCPEPSRLDDWFLGWPTLVLRAPPLATLDGGAAQVYTEVPSMERSVAMQLCPKTASTWHGNQLLPSRACRQ